MKKKPSALERVKTLAESLPAQDRLDLFQHLANRPDSGIKYLPPASVPMSSRRLSADEKEALKRFQQLTYQVECKIQDGYIIYVLDGLEIFRAKFDPETYAEVFCRKLKSDEVFLKLSDEQQ